ncbi:MULTISPECIES: hypothetical protein [Labilibaculum]|uniref:Uncharacterized protein n=1 Tax=Labilibaculum euxinus TaxID=2686357 RepID=A0A7M4D9V1_9BACT|nr:MULTISPECIES: hypothetical protein [Labilibaculum]MUP39430.1 hypothetical protein [Labilibaculum euxinus]MVB08635.1 hypothetical protein [Labilibaculum euxinus]
MVEVNLKLINNYVNTKYGDIRGVIEIDGFDNISSIYKLCEDHRYKTDDKFIVGFGLEETTTNGVGRKEQVVCNILFLFQSEYGDNYDEIKAKLIRKDKLKVHKKSFLISYTDLNKYIKRYDFMAITEMLNGVRQIEVEDVYE